MVLFWEKGLLCCQVAVVGRDSYGFVFPPRVTASAAPLTDEPHQPQPNGPHPGCNPCFSQSWGCMWAIACSPEVSGWVCRLRPITLASTDVTGLKECEECGGAEAGVSILGPGQRGGRASSVSADSSALLCWPIAGLTGWGWRAL